MDCVIEIFEHLPVPLVIFYRDWRILGCNQAFANLTGFSTDEIIRSSPFLYGIKPAEGGNVDLVGTGPELGEQLKFSTSILTKSGTVIPVNAYLSEAKDDKGDIINYYAVVEPVETKCELPVANLLECMTDPVLLVDKNTDITFANKEALTMLKKNTGDIVGKKLMDVFKRPSYTLFYKKLMYSMNERLPSSLEDFDPHFNRWYDIRFYPCGDEMVVHFRSINLRKHQDWWLRMTSFALDKVNEQVLLTDANGRIIYTNASALMILGYKKDEARALKAFDLIGPMSTERWGEIVDRTRVEGKIEFNEPLIGKDGKTFPARIDVYFLKFFNVEYVCLVANTAAVE